MEDKKHLSLLVETNDDSITENSILSDLNKFSDLFEKTKNTYFAIKRKLIFKVIDEKKDHSEEPKKHLILAINIEDNSIFDDLDKLSNLCDEIKSICYSTKKKLETKDDNKEKDHSKE